MIIAAEVDGARPRVPRRGRARARHALRLEHDGRDGPSGGCWRAAARPAMPAPTTITVLIGTDGGRIVSRHAGGTLVRRWRARDARPARPAARGSTTRAAAFGACTSARRALGDCASSPSTHPSRGLPSASAHSQSSRSLQREAAATGRPRRRAAAADGAGGAADGGHHSCPRPPPPSPQPARRRAGAGEAPFLGSQLLLGRLRRGRRKLSGCAASACRAACRSRVDGRALGGSHSAPPPLRRRLRRCRSAPSGQQVAQITVAGDRCGSPPRSLPSVCTPPKLWGFRVRASRITWMPPSGRDAGAREALGARLAVLERPPRAPAAAQRRRAPRSSASCASGDGRAWRTARSRSRGRHSSAYLRVEG